MDRGNQLFRFSMLRGAVPSPNSSRITVSPQNISTSTRLEEQVKQVVAWLRQADLSNSRLLELATSLGGTLPVDPQFIEGAKALHAHRIHESLVASIRDPATFDRVALAQECDLLTAATLLGELHGISDTLTPADWIASHPIVVDNLPAAWIPATALARAPGIVQHFVVRETLVGYQMGEIEDIKNYLKGERKEHSLRYLKVDEEETVVENESETNRSSETSTQQRSQMSATTQETANSSLGFDARVKTDGQYGPTKVSTDVGFQYNSSLSETRQAASEFSTEVVTRSVEEVRERELRRVTRRTRVELEEKRAHSVDNVDAPAHTIGIYRWVDSVWKATTYDLGPRLVLEFLIPQPGRAMLPAPVPALPAGLPPAPQPLPADLFDTLDGKHAAALAATYGAEGIKAPPVANQVIGMPFGSTEFKDNPPDRIGAVVVKEVKVPEGYVGETVIVIASAMDRMGVDVASNLVIDVAGRRHTTFLDIAGGASNPFLVNGGPGVVGRPNTDFRTLGVSVASNYGPGATIPVAVQCEDTRGVTGFIEVHCRASDAAITQWKLDTIQTLSSAYRARLSEWESLRLAKTFEAAAAPPDPDLDALCRHACIASLLGTWPNAANLHDTEGWPKPAALSGDQAELMAFMEQAFEWNNLQYVLYPYYWAEQTQWKPLNALDHADPRVREFLRCGAARIVVPVPLALTEAVLFFLATRLPWFGGGAPIPGSLDYLPIAEEIRRVRAEVGDDGLAIDEYRYTLPTSLTILQETGTLPAPTA